MVTPTYPAGHWLRSSDPELVLAAGAKQQALTYSRIKSAFLFELLGDISGATVLDFGCGAGFFAAEAAKRGAARVFCLDAQPTALAAAALLASRLGLSARMTFLAAQDAPFLPEARFSVICLRDVIEHVADDLALLQSLAKHLAPGGRMVLATQNSWSLNYVLEGGRRRFLLGQRDWLGWDPTHVRFYTPRRLSATLRKAGLRPQAWRAAYLFPHKIPNPFKSEKQFWRIEPLAHLDRVLGRLFPLNHLGWSLMVGATT